MQYLLEINNEKDKFVMEVLRHFRFVKTKPLTRANVQFINELKESIEQVKQAKRGKTKLKNAKAMLNDL